MAQWKHRQGTISLVLVLVLLLPLAHVLAGGQETWMEYPGAIGGLLVLLGLAYLIAAAPGDERQNLVFANISLLFSLGLVAMAGTPEWSAPLGLALYPILFATVGLAICAMVQSRAMLPAERTSVLLAAGAALGVTALALLFGLPLPFSS